MLDVIYTTGKNELKMILLSKSTKIWILFPLKNDKLSPVLRDQVTQCMGSATLARQARMMPHHKRQKNYGLHTITRAYNIARANKSTRTYQIKV